MMEGGMNRFLTTALCLAVLAAPVHAGGPVVVVEEPPPVVDEGPASSKGLLPLLIVPLVLCIFMCGSNEDAPAPPP